MSKFLFPLVLAAASVLPLAKAEAGHYYCGPTVRYGGYCRPAPVVVYRDDYCYRPTYYRSYYRPAPVYYRDVDYCYPRTRVYVSRPRVSFFFGF